MSLVDVALSPIREETVRFNGYCGNNSKTSVNSRKQHEQFPEDPSILVYLSVGGSLIPLRVLEPGSITWVKLRVQTCKGLVVKKQKPVLRYGNVLHLVLKLFDLLLITVKTVHGEELEFHVDSYRNVGYLKKKIFKEGKGFVDVEDQEVFYSGDRLDNPRLIADICKNKDDSIHLLVNTSAKVRAVPVGENFEILVVAPKFNERRDTYNELDELDLPDESFWFEPVVINPTIKLTSAFWGIIRATFDGLMRGHEPIQSSDGMGGTYFMQDPLGQGYVSVFKPIDEEPMAVNNPRGQPVSTNGEGLKRGTVVGEGAVREVAAFLLDHPKSGPRAFTSEIKGFVGVPPTFLVECLHQGFNHPEGYEGALQNIKMGSLQMFLKNEGTCEDVGPGIFPVDAVQKISVLDIRVANADRHAGNILISKGEDGQISLIPIDHGYCLPVNFEDCTFDWLYWPQARQPYSAEVVDYIRSLNAEEDIALVKLYGWDMPNEVARTLRISTMLLQKGVEKGLTPFDIGSIMCRENPDKESVIEEIVHEAQDNLATNMSETKFLKHVSQIMDRWFDELTK